MNRTTVMVISLFATSLWVGAAQAAQAKPSATLTCQQSKLAADGQLEHCLAQNSADILAGGTDSSAMCFANFNAQLANADAIALKAGASCRYVDNGDGTVSDLNTVLMWEQTTGTVGTLLTNPPVTDVNNYYTWSSSGGTAPDGTAFTSFLGTLNYGLSHDGGVSTPITGCFANHCDWRLPSIVELQGIVDLGAAGCSAGTSLCIDPIFGPTQSSSIYWSATTYARDQLSAWTVSFTNGFAFLDGKTNFPYVRAVRSGL